MANTLNENLTGRVIVFKQEALRHPFVAAEHPFRVDGGFGAQSYTSGNALMGEWLATGERDRMEGYMVERFATDEEISAAGEKRAAV